MSRAIMVAKHDGLALVMQTTQSSRYVGCRVRFAKSEVQRARHAMAHFTGGREGGKMGTVLLAAGLLAALFLLGHAGGWRIAVSAIAIGVLACFPGREVLGASTSTLAILAVAAVGLISSTRVTLPWRFAPLLVYLLLLATVQWDGDGAMWDRVAELALASVAWVVGVFLRDAVDGSLRAQRVFVALLLAVLALQAVVAGLQYLGVDIFTSTGPNADLTEGRSSGTFSHPGNLGKVVFFITMMLLPLSLS